MKIDTARIQADPFKRRVINRSGVRTNNSVRSGNSSILEKIKTVAKIVFSLLLSLVLFSINPGIFFISFVAGIAFSQAVQNAVDKINTFMKHYKWPAVAGSVLMAVVVLPVFIATGSALWAAHMGSILSQRAQNQAS